MQVNDWVSLIGIILVFAVGLINIALTVHKSTVEGITKFRQNWINEVRETTASVLCGNKSEVIRQIEKLRLFINPLHSLDNEIDSLLLELENHCIMTNDSHSQETRINYQGRILLVALQLRESMQVYLKMEWTRVKYESAINKFPYHYCWKFCWWPWSGFNEEKAIKHILRELNGGKTANKIPVEKLKDTEKTETLD